MITTSAKWKSLSKTKVESIALVRLYYGNESNYLALANDDFSFDGDNYLGIVKGMPKSISEVDIKTHAHSIATGTLELSNLEFEPGKRFSDFIETLGQAGDYGFYNRKVEIRQYLKGMTVWSDAFPLFTGIVRDIDHDRKTAKLTMEDDSELVYIDIATDVVTDADGAGDSPVPPENLGKVKPIVYGDHRIFLDSDDPNVASTTQENNLVQMIDLGLDSTSKRRWLIAGHELNSIDSIWGFDRELKQFVRIESFTIEQNTSAGAIVSTVEGSSFDNFVFGSGTSSNSGWTDPDNANDRNLSTQAYHSHTGDGVNFDVKQKYSFNIDFPTYAPLEGPLLLSLKGSQFGSVKIRARVDGTGVDANWTFTINGVDGKTYDDGLVHYFSTQKVLKAGIENSVKIEHEGIIAYSSVARVFELYKVIRYIPSDQLMLYASCRGKEYGTWIDGRTGHADNNQSGQVIENYAGMIESVLRDKMGLPDSRIDTSAFDTASNDLSGYKGNLILTKNCRDTIEEICQDCYAWVWQKPDGKFTMATLKATYSASDRKISHNDIKGHTFDRTPLRDLKTTVQVTYLRSGKTDKNQMKTSESLVVANETYYNVTQDQGKLVYESKTIKDLTTANNLRDRILKDGKSLHNISNGNVGREHLELDVGDVLEFSDMPFKVNGEDIENNVTRVGQTIYKYWWIYRAERGRRLTFKAKQLHDLS